MNPHSAVILCARLCIAIQNLSIGVNVVCEGSPSRILRVLLISLGITIRPRSSTLLTMPVAFIYLSPLLVGAGSPRPWDGKPVPYNNFTNYAVSICKRQEIIPHKRKTPLPHRSSRGIFIIAIYVLVCQRLTARPTLFVFFI